ncbi:MAG: acylphosphatase [Candidatus Thermoplasmatota archaeon]|nr:acylphosphatase [Candidatus Thermoplasmatota archaeon]
MKRQVHVVISGHVQGVWYRASTKQQAEALGVTGWVKNTAEGNVEAVFEGDSQTVQDMVEWCKRGPPLAQVTSVQVTEKQYDGHFVGFAIKRD